MDQNCEKTEETVRLRRSWSAGDITTKGEFWDPYMDPMYYHDSGHNGVNFSWMKGERHSYYVITLASIIGGITLFLFICFGIVFITTKTVEYATDERSAHVMIEWYGCNDEYQAAQGANTTYQSKSKYMDEVFSRMANDRQINIEELMRTSLTKETVKRYCTNVTLETTTKAMNAIKKRMSSGEKFVRK